MIMSRGIKAAAFAAAMAMTLAAQAVTTLEVELGPATVVGNQAQMEVTLTFFDTDSNDTGLTYFQLDVSQSDAILSAGGTDYSRFSFTPASPLLDNWGPLPIFDFSIGPQYSLGVDTTNFPNDGLPSGVSQVVGTLNVLLDGLPSGNYLVDIEYTDVDNFDGTLGFYQEPLDAQNPALGLDPQTENIVTEVTFPDGGTSRFLIENNTPAVPEPATLALGLIGLTAIGTRRRGTRPI